MIFIHILYGRCVVFSNQFGLKLVISAIFLLQKTNLRKNLGTTKLRKIHHAKLKYVHITNINYITNRHQLLV